MPAGATRLARSFPALTSNEKMRSFTSQTNGSEVFEAGKKREMRGTSIPNAAAPPDVRKVLRSMQIIGAFHTPAEKQKMSGTSSLMRFHTMIARSVHFSVDLQAPVAGADRRTRCFPHGGWRHAKPVALLLRTAVSLRGVESTRALLILAAAQPFRT